MARRLCQLLFTLALLYVAAVGAYAFFAYQSPRPDVVTIAGEFHEWVRARFRPSPSPAPPPGTLPPFRDADAAPTSIPLPPAPPAAPPTDARSLAIAKVRDELLPEVKVIIGRMDDPDAKVQTLKVDARVVLVKARDLINPLRDGDPEDREAHRIGKQIDDLLIAVDKR
jgi:hypothetical protein